MTLTRRLFQAAALASGMLLAACGESGAGESRAGAYERPTDMAKGDPNAPVVMVEYASVACGACAAFHAQAMPKINEYVEDGTVRFVFREMLTGQPQIAAAGFMLARCAGDDRYFDMIDVIFENYPTIMQSASRPGGVAQQLRTIAGSAGIGQQQFQQCLSDQENLDQLQARNEQAAADGVQGTPTFVINGQTLTRGQGPAGAGFIYFVDGQPLEIDGEFVPGDFNPDTFERIILHFRDQATDS